MANSAHEVNSSNIKSLYHRQDGKVEILYKRSQEKYITCKPIDESVFEQWLKSPSVGKHLNGYIIPTFGIRKMLLEDATEQPQSKEAPHVSEGQ